MLKNYFCDQCDSQLVNVGDFYICPKHGQVNIPLEDNIFYTEEQISQCHKLLAKNMPLLFQRQIDWLLDEMVKQQPIGVAWQLRDCYEFLIRFLAITGVCEIIRLNSKDAVVEKFLNILMKPQGISLGDWWKLADYAFTALSHYEKEDLVVEPLICLLINQNGRKSKIAKSLGAGNNNVINWRNRVFGHGIFKRDLTWYAKDAEKWLIGFFTICEELNTIFAEIDFSIKSNQITLSNKGKNLQLSPLVVYQPCSVCKSNSFLFIDKNRLNRKSFQLRSYYLDQTCGTLWEAEKCSLLKKILAEQNVSLFKWVRSHYDAEEYNLLTNAVIKDFKKNIFHLNMILVF